MWCLGHPICSTILLSSLLYKTTLRSVWDVTKIPSDCLNFKMYCNKRFIANGYPQILPFILNTQILPFLPLSEAILKVFCECLYTIWFFKNTAKCHPIERQADPKNITMCSHLSNSPFSFCIFRRIKMTVKSKHSESIQDIKSPTLAQLKTNKRQFPEWFQKVTKIM